MRSLWQIEQAVLDITLAEYPTSNALKRQIESAKVESFENSGAGFFSHLQVDAAAPLLHESSPLRGGHGSVLGIEHGMGFMVFLKDGRLSFVEGYCNGDVSTNTFDFETAVFAITPWGAETDRGE